MSPRKKTRKLDEELVNAEPEKIRIEGVTKRFKTARGEVHALDNVRLEIGEGEFLCLLGPSGCGKSTLLYMIAGLEKPDEGQVLCDGKPVTGPGRERLVMFQEHALFPWRDVLGNVLFGLELKPDLDRAARREVARYYLQLVGLLEAEHSHVHELSGGMKQRVALARSLAPNPRVLLMDEPFASLDAMTREQLYGDLQRIWQARRKTIVFVTHNVREAICLGDRVVVMAPRPGRPVAEFKIDLPRPRDVNSQKVAKLAKEVLASLKDEAAAATEREAQEKEEPEVKLPEPESVARQSVESEAEEAMKRRILTAVLFFAAFVGIWQLLVGAGVWSDVFVPSPSQIVDYLGRGITDGSLAKSFLVTVRRLLLGYFVGIAVGLPIGILIARSRFAADTIGVLALGMQTLPSVCWVPLALVWFGQTETAMLFVVVMGTVWSIVLATQNGLLSVPPIFARAARTMGAGPLHTLLRVQLPAALPYLVAGMKQGWAFAWRSLMAAEIYVTILTGFGLGHLLHYGRELHAMDQVLGVMLVIVVLGLLVDRVLFSPIESFLHRRWGTGDSS